ncbi:MAG: DctP family TRAP transporter solute-binding subunit [Bacillus sp. (in: firmicutes)]
MRNFMIAAVGIITLLTIYIGFRHDFGQKASWPTDYEQNGLDKQIVINFSHVVAENTPKGQAAEKFAKLVEEKTDGAIQVEVYPNSSLYMDDDELRALQNGDVQMIAPSFSKVTELIPDWQVLDLPYLFRDHEDIRKVFTGDMRDKLLNMLEEHDLKGLAFWNNGFKQITASDTPVRTPDNLNGMTIRTMPSEMLDRQLNLVDAETMNANFDQVYSLLKKGQLDGQENSISNIYTKGFYQVQNHMTLTNHGLLGYAVIMNGEFWNSLSGDFQSAITEAMKEATIWNLQQSEQINDASLLKLKESSQMDIHELSSKDHQHWQETFRPLYNYYEKNFDADLLKEIEETIN